VAVQGQANSIYLFI